MDALQIIVPAVTGILGLFIGYFLNQAIYERKRRDDLADREFARRALVYDQRIQEARIYVDSIEELVRFMSKVNHVYLEESEPEKRRERLYRIYQRDDDSSPEGIKKGMSLYVLNDKELAELHNKFADFLSRAEELGHIKKEQDSEAEEAITQALFMADVLILRMKERLDELAKTIK